MERNRICWFYHTPSPASPHSHLGHWGTCRTVTPVYLFLHRTRWPPGYSTSPRQRAAGPRHADDEDLRAAGPHHLHVVYRQGAPSASRRGESPMVPGPDCVKDGRMCPNGIHHAARSVSADTVRTWHHRTFTSSWRWRSTLPVNDMQMMRTCSTLSWTGWIVRRPSGTRRE